MAAHYVERQEDLRIRANGDNGERNVDHDGGEIGCVLVSQTATKYDPPPTIR